MDASQFHVIYPSYLDSSKTIAQGRRIGQELAIEAPTVSDLSQALQSLNIRHVLQPHKGYSRDIETLWDNPGRVKVDLKGPIIMSQFESKRGLLKELAQIIPNLPARQQRLEQAKQQALLEAQKAEEEAQKSKQGQKLLQQQQQQQQLGSSSSKTTNKKKGKKKR